jgi:NADH:ubiquinone oxidoreductase subunit 2 (subunit N)
MVIGTLGVVRVIRTVFVEPPVFEVVPAKLDRGIRVAVGLACVGVVFMGLLMEPLYRAATYGKSAILH